MARDFEESRQLLYKIAHKVKRRVFAAGARSVQFEDIFQELTIAWCLARDAWDESRGIPFQPFLIRGCYQHINRWVDEEMREHNIAPFDLDAPIPGSDSDDELGSIISPAMTDEKLPDEQVIEKDLRSYLDDPMRWRNRHNAAMQLSERTKQFLELLDAPSPELVEMMNALRGTKVEPA